MTAHILVIDDDPAERRTLKAAIEAQGHAVHIAESDQAGLELLRRKRGEIGAVLLDLKTPDRDGLSLLSSIGSIDPDVPVIVQTVESETNLAVEAMRAGAFDFVVKPRSLERLASALSSALKLHESDAQGRTVKRARSGAVGFGDIVAASSAMARVVELGRRAAHSNIPVMLEGEPGVGKELVARAIHSGSDRSGRPFIVVNCGTVPHSLLESVLFGQESLPSSGVVEGLTGKFIEANGGSLFLEGISELPLHVQGKLLDAVQKGEIEAVGASRSRKANVRLIAATNKDLIEEVKSGRFREDLYYRLNVFPITIPALRRHKEDIPHLARAFAERFSAEQRLAKPLSLGPGALALLTAFDWPGNIRQLENAVFRAVILAESHELSGSDFPQIAAQMPAGESPKTTAPGRPVPAGEGQATPASPPAEAASSSLQAAGGHVEPVAPSAGDGGAHANVIVSTDDSGNVRKLAEIEEELIRFALKFYRGQMSQVARKLGIGRSTLYRKLKDYGIDPDDPQKHAA